MKITIDQRTLRDAVDKTALFIPKKTMLPALECMRISANGKLEFFATDLQTFIHLTVPLRDPVVESYLDHTDSDHGVRTDDEGTVNVPAELFQKAIDSMKEGCQTTLESDAKTRRLKLLLGSKLLAQLAIDETTQLPAPTIEWAGARECYLEIETLRAIARKCLPFVSTDEMRPAMMGIHFAYNGTELAVTATNGHQLVRLALPLVAGEEAFEFILPPDLLEKACKVLSGIVTLRWIMVTPERKADTEEIDPPVLCVQLADEHIEITARAMDEVYPDAGAVIARSTESTPYHLTFARQETLATLRRLALVASRDGSRVHLRMNKENYSPLEIAAENYNGDSGSERMNAIFESTEGAANDPSSALAIDFNSELLRDTLAAIDADDVTARFTSATRAAVIEETFFVGPDIARMTDHADGPKFEIEALYLIMPLTPEQPRDDMRGTALSTERAEREEVTA